MDRVPMRGELWRGLFLDFLHLWIGVARIQIGERRLRAIEQTSGALESGDGVFERRLLRAVCDGLDLLELLTHAGFHRGREMRVFDFVEDRVMKWQRALLEKRIVG